MSSSIIIERYDEKGELIFRAFQCKIDPEEDMEFEAQFERDKFLKRHDPNRIDGRYVRRELGDKMVNLEMRVNRIKRRFL